MSASRPAPLSSLPGDAARTARGLLTDIDDTLTRDGRIEADALAALHDLRAADVPVIARFPAVGWRATAPAASPTSRSTTASSRTSSRRRSRRSSR